MNKPRSIVMLRICRYSQSWKCLIPQENEKWKWHWHTDACHTGHTDYVMPSKSASSPSAISGFCLIITRVLEGFSRWFGGG
ncbi:hypothetical protein FKM82_028247 [Ascaphus truei]